MHGKYLGFGERKINTKEKNVIFFSVNVPLTYEGVKGRLHLENYCFPEALWTEVE